MGAKHNPSYFSFHSKDSKLIIVEMIDSVSPVSIILHRSEGNVDYTHISPSVYESPYS